jgi:hypothetical protein
MVLLYVHVSTLAQRSKEGYLNGRGRERGKETEKWKGEWWKRRGRIKRDEGQRKGKARREVGRGKCSLPLRRVYEIKRMYLVPRTHGLFIT